ncbi:hypothetical protein HS088_TW19G00259 [Tripterygium wilfordii]|uniref:DUF1771 domain-containing protein n=2 Tax=Tripterygium wilfordii TaxID=458696 RepID=A0A7J7CA93_TRIWF|nr:hypothetical protein HS088_TW19G00259 [Tripterygium wilfordii]
MQAVSVTTHSDAEERELEQLLEAFGSEFSLEDIACAYSEARHDVDMAGEILCGMRERTSRTAISTSRNKFKSADAMPFLMSSELKGSSAASTKESSKSGSSKFYHETNSENLESKDCSASIDSKDLPVSGVSYQENSLSVTARHNKQAEIEEFLFKMLGDGFQLDMTVIQDVLGQCGYDLHKSVNKLLDLSVSSLEKRGNVVDEAAEISREKSLDCESFFHQELSHQPVAAQIDGTEGMSRKLTKSRRRDKDKLDMGKEILQSLFTVPERSEETPQKIRLLREVKRSRAFGKLVTEPFKDPAVEHKLTAAEPQIVSRDDVEVDENSYDVLRQAAKEHWVTMKAYYTASVDAFVNGDHARAAKFLEEGHFFSKKAREADEKSWEKIIENGEEKEDEVLPIDLRSHKPKEALRLLRFYLTTVSAMKYLRLIVGADGEDDTREARKRLLLKQLEKESIQWTEGDNGNTILIQVDRIDPKSLSFAKNKNPTPN